MAESPEERQKRLNKETAVAKKTVADAMEEARLNKVKASYAASKEESSEQKDADEAKSKEAWAKFSQTSKDMLKPAKGYDNYQVLMAEIIGQCVEMHYALASSIGPMERDLLKTVTGTITGLTWTIVRDTGALAVTGLTLGAVRPELRTIQMIHAGVDYLKTTPVIGTGVNWLSSKLFPDSWKNGKLPDTVMNSATCDATGKVTFKSLKDELPPGTPQHFVDKMNAYNEAMHRAFLSDHGYVEAAGGSYQNTSGTVLTPVELNRLRSDPVNGLVASARKQRTELTKAPIAYDGVEIDPPAPSSFKP